MFTEVKEAPTNDHEACFSFQGYLEIMAPGVDTSEKFERLAQKEKIRWDKYLIYYHEFQTNYLRRSIKLNV